MKHVCSTFLSKEQDSILYGMHTELPRISYHIKWLQGLLPERCVGQAQAHTLSSRTVSLSTRNRSSSCGPSSHRTLRSHVHGASHLSRSSSPRSFAAAAMTRGGSTSATLEFSDDARSANSRMRTTVCTQRQLASVLVSYKAEN